MFATQQGVVASWPTARENSLRIQREVSLEKVLLSLTFADNGSN